MPEFIANQIAAGEVVQRPESVVKELVENSFDAGADTIMVIVKDSGKSLIHIIDNGMGMEREDLALACRRHATSKIYSSEDLEAINTFGFRGEALASIASVSNVEIRTLPKGKDHGWRLTSEPMKDIKIEPFAIDSGTQIFVRNLFYNIPVRKKFLKTNLTEFRYISETMLRFALSKPNIRFVFYDDDTLIFDAKPAPLLQRIKEVIGESTAKSIVPLQYEESGIKLYGYIGLPSIAKQTRANQYLFLNSRSIQSKSISFAVFSAYEHLLEKSKNPFYVLNIELDPKDYDVNVHPQKHEVKFEDERLIHNLVNRAVVRALAENNIIPDTALDTIDSISPFQRVTVENEDAERETLLVNKMTGEIIDRNSNAPNNYSSNYSNNYSSNYSNNNYSAGNSAYRHQYASSKPLNFDINIFKHNFEQNNTEQNNFDNITDSNYLSNEGARNEFINPRNEFINQDTKSHFELLKKISSEELQLKFLQIHNKYIILEVPSGILLFDQHAAHERVLYERVLKKVGREFATSQELLFSQTIQLDKSEIIILNEIQDELKRLGYNYEINGDNIEIFSIPLDDAYNFNSISIKEILDQYSAEQKIRFTDKRDYLAASIACKAAIKTGKSMSKEETLHLINDLLKCDMPYCCPHGRPIIIEMSLYRLDKLFGRVI